MAAGRGRIAPVAGSRRPGPWAPVVLLVAAATSGACTGSGAVRSVRRAAPEELCPARLPGDRWQSAPWAGAPDGCAWLRLGARQAVEVPHGLGRVPAAVLVYVSFEPSGQDGVLAAGDVARVVAVGERSVTVGNATEQPFYARIVLW